MTDAGAVRPPRVSAAATAQTLGLLKPDLAQRGVQTADGYLDLLGEQDATGAHVGQRLMLNRGLVRIYQRLWRPAALRLMTGPAGPSPREELQAALAMLSISPGDRVLDVACGPGNFTRPFSEVADADLVVGLDASRPMLATAVRETESANVSYVLGDASSLPFQDGSFNAVCCFAALYLIDDPMRAIAEIARILAPGGRVALMATCNRGFLPTATTNAIVRGLMGVRIFGPDELTQALSEQGLIEVEQRIRGVAQFASARKPPAPHAAAPA